MIRLVRVSEDAKLPIRGTEYSAAFDLHSAEKTTVMAFSRKLVSIGLKLEECPEDTYLRIAPRSGLAVKGIDVGAGVVDCDYRGEIKVLLINQNKDDFKVNVGDRIAQMIPEALAPNVSCCIVGEENDTSVIRKTRGEGGFGSTH